MYRIEILPRFGTKIGVIWKDDDTLGSIRLVDEEEETKWNAVIEFLNKEEKEDA